MNLNDLFLLSKKFHKFAAIIHPPRNIKLFLIAIKQNFDKFTKSFNDIIEPFKKLNEEQLHDIMYDMFRYSVSEYDIENFPCYEYERHIDNTKRDIDFIFKYKPNHLDVMKWFSYINDNLKYFIEKLKKSLKDWQEALNEDRFVDFSNNLSGEYELKYFKENYPMLDVENIFKLKQLPKLFEELIQYCNSIIVKLNEWMRFNGIYYQKDEERRPQSEDIEILYHTSINARQIASKGFSERPGEEGLGGASNDKSGSSAISFTSDFYVAKEIARCLREAILIAKGEVSWNDILEWSGDLKERIINSYFEIYSRFLKEEDKEKPSFIFNLYKVYLTFSDSENIRYNPWFIGDSKRLMNLFATKSPNDVGIIAAKVNITDSNILFAHSMHEYRVSPKSVISIEKVIFEGN